MMPFTYLKILKYKSVEDTIRQLIMTELVMIAIMIGRFFHNLGR